MNELKIQDLVLNVLTQEQFDSAEKDATQLYLTPDTSIDSAEKGVAGGVATLDSNAKVPTNQIPALPYLPTSGGTVTGDISLRKYKGVIKTILPPTDYGFTRIQIISQDSNYAELDVINTAGTCSFYVDSVGNGVVYSNKKINLKTGEGQSADINGNKILDESDKGVSNGVASLGADGKVPNEQLPDALTNAVAKTGDTMTGALKVPTPASTTNDTTVPTTEWVNDFVADKYFGFPNYNAGITVSSHVTDYVIPSSGILLVNVPESDSTNTKISINGELVASMGSGEFPGRRLPATLPVKAGDKVTTDISNGTVKLYPFR